MTAGQFMAKPIHSCLPWKVIPLLGEMSATQTKGCPFPEEKGDHEVADESTKLLS